MAGSCAKGGAALAAVERSDTINHDALEFTQNKL
jgi:hypothetical protein